MVFPVRNIMDAKHCCCDKQAKACCINHCLFFTACMDYFYIF